MNIKRIGKAIMVLLLATPTLTSMDLMAQNLKMPTLEDLLPGGAPYRIAETLPGLQWWGDVCIKPGIDSLFAVNTKNGKETLLTTREKVNKVLNSLITPTETTATPGHKGNKVQHFYNTEFPWPDKPYMLIKLPARYIVYDFEKDEFVKGLPQAGERNGANIDYTPEGGHIAYTVKNNLFVFYDIANTAVFENFIQNLVNRTITINVFPLFVFEICCIVEERVVAVFFYKLDSLHNSD